MQPFYLPVKFFFGVDALSAFDPAPLGKKPMIVTGANSAKASGALDDMLAQLSRYNHKPVIFDGVSANPRIGDCLKAAELFTREKCDYIIGIGGGSPLDAAKAISLIAANHLNRTEIYHLEAIKAAYPIVAIPTTSGTGSEVTQYSVLTDENKSKKAGLGHNLAFAKQAYVDPKYTLSLNPIVTRDTAVDALSHLLEGIYSNKRQPVLYPIIYQGVKWILEYLPKAVQNPADLVARRKLSAASLYGGMVIAQTSTTLQHSLGYPLTSDFGLPHGLANGIAMKAMLELYRPHLEQELADLFAAVEMSKTGFEEWLDKLDMRAGVKLTDEWIAAKTPEVMQSRNMALNPATFSAADVAALYKKISD